MMSYKNKKTKTKTDKKKKHQLIAEMKRVLAQLEPPLKLL